MNTPPAGPDKEALLAKRMAALKVNEADIEEIPGNSGRASTSIMLVHRPSGLRIKCQATSRREQNRLIALELLLDKIEKWEKSAAHARRPVVRVISLIVAILGFVIAYLILRLFAKKTSP